MSSFLFNNKGGMMKGFALVFAALICGATSAGAADAEKKVGMKAGDWVVMQQTDQMTDKISCVGLHKGDWNIQASQDKLYVSLTGRGGVDAYVIRIDDEPAKAMRLASRLEKNISSAILDQSADSLGDAKRLRIQILTVLKSAVIEDISLKGLSEAVQYMKSRDC